MPKLSDTQAILLSTAAQRDNASLLPLPETVAAAGAPKALTSLIKQGFTEERETTDSAATHRTDGDIHYGLFITSAGLAAIGIEPEPGTALSHMPTTAATARRETKSGSVLALLRRAEGATLAELITATGWLPHTTRAALTGLRKKGLSVERGKRDDVTFYRVLAA